METFLTCTGLETNSPSRLDDLSYRGPGGGGGGGGGSYPLNYCTGGGGGGGGGHSNHILCRDVHLFNGIAHSPACHVCMSSGRRPGQKLHHSVFLPPVEYR